MADGYTGTGQWVLPSNAESLAAYWSIPTYTITTTTDNIDTGSGSGGGGGGGGGGGDFRPIIHREIESDEEAKAEMEKLEKSKTDNKSMAQKATAEIVDLEPAEVGRVNHVETEPYDKILKQFDEAQKAQVAENVNAGVEKGTAVLNENTADAAGNFKTMLTQVDRDEQKALDQLNAYDAARNGTGIGQDQYGSVRNTAAVNRLTVQKEQGKLAEDTKRQVADLKAQGDYVKASLTEQINQEYLTKLNAIHQWADAANVGIDEFNIQVAQWEEEYKLALNQLKVSANATMYDIANADWTDYSQQLAEIGKTLMEAGITPTMEQIRSAWMTEKNALDYLYGYYPNGVVPIY